MIPLNRPDFIKKYDFFITNLLMGTGILKGTLFSQAIIESSTKPTYLVGSSKLSQEANNLFGIKADANYKGNIYTIKTREQKKSGEEYYITANFRKYDSIEDSFKDYVKFILNNKRYRENGFFEAKTVKGQGEALQRAGYATDLNYSNIINSVYNSIKKNFNLNTQTKKIISSSSIILFLILFAGYKYYYK